MKLKKILQILIIFLSLISMPIIAGDDIPFKFSGEKEAESSKKVKAIQDALKNLKKKTKKLHGHLKKIEKKAKKFQKHLKKSKNADDFYASLPRSLRNFKKSEANNFYTILKKNKKKLKKGIKNLGSKMGNLNTAMTHLGNAEDSIKSLRVWDPENAAEDPTYGLSLISDSIRGKAAVLPKGLKELFLYYADSAAAFAKALQRLDKTLQNARQGSVCGKLGSRNMRSISKFIKNSTNYNCADCRVQGSWSTFPSFMVTRCSEDGFAGGGFLFYNGKSGKGYHIYGADEVKLIHNWMVNNEVSNSQKNIWWLNKLSKYYRERKVDIEKDRQRILKNKKSLKEFYECGINKKSKYLSDLAQEGETPFLKYALLKTGPYNRNKKIIFERTLDKYFILTGIITAIDQGKKVNFGGVSVRITDGKDGPRIGSTSTSTGKKFCLTVLKKKLKGTPYVVASRGEYNGTGELSFSPNDNHQFAGMKITRINSELEDILKDANTLANSCSHKPCDQCRLKRIDSCIDCKNKACSGLCATSKRCLPCKDKLCSECQVKNKLGCIADKEPPKEEKEDEKGDTKVVGLGNKCHGALDRAKALVPLYKLRRQEFRTSFESENGAAACSSNKAAYYFVEMLRLYGEYSAALGVVENITDPMNTEQIRSNQEVSACYDRYAKALTGKKIMEKNIAYAKRKFNQNDCDLRQVENNGNVFPPGMSSFEVESRIGSTGGLWRSSAGGASFCITEEFVTQTVQGLSKALNPFSNLGFSVSVISNGNNISATGSLTTPDTDCTITTSFKYALDLQESTGTQTFNINYQGTGPKCNNIPAPIIQTSTLSKVSNTCNL